METASRWLLARCSYALYLKPDHEIRALPQ
jgi:hypothetical protein